MLANNDAKVNNTKENETNSTEIKFQIIGDMLAFHGSCVGVNASYSTLAMTP